MNRKSKYDDATRDQILKEAWEWVRPRTEEELEEARRALKYPGRYRKPTPSTCQCNEVTLYFFGIQIKFRR
ncbi:hypothetical protein [Priestia megaterium]|uniref:Uncharacterized protein n=1 Tax=Priestia megaterium TaxID=1404 RepID=A0A6M6E0B6_PRIMG|nr:hypothetical protein [Priestia megaterium]QJX80553.1 hypothetical protein FDZ14_31175 [Priestia megaterium]